MTTPTAVGVEDALETLVRQFSDPLACLRELVQNSLDAGSRQIDVALSHTDGVMTLEVQDQGEGMDKHIIDTKLTRLFASSKEGDFTKIGRFGIGFVSVFALEPDAVVVDTGRAGEKWRVLFRKDRTFACIALEEPIAGTRVRIIKAVSSAEYDDLRARALSVLRYWCKHVEGEISFEGQVISGPLALERVLVEARHQEEGTLVVVGIVEGFRTFGGFYNKGLTLHEGEAGGLPGLAFKISSRYLEHTLTRDNVLHDDAFQKAMAIVHRLAGEPLHAALWARLAKDTTGPSAEPLWRALASRLRLNALPAAQAEQPIVPAEGGALSIKGLQRQKAPLYFAPTHTPLTQACHQAGLKVLLVGEQGPAIAQVVHEAAGLQLVDLERDFVLPLPATEAEVQAFSPLQAQLAHLLPDLKVAALVPGHLPSLPHEVAIGVARLDEPTPITEIQKLAGGLFSRKRTLVINLDHPAVAALLPRAAQEPELCGWLLARLFLLGRGELDAPREAALLMPAITRREARTR
jgi:molecular chaperone HtpG